MAMVGPVGVLPARTDTVLARDTPPLLIELRCAKAGLLSDCMMPIDYVTIRLTRLDLWAMVRSMKQNFREPETNCDHLPWKHLNISVLVALVRYR